MKPQQQVQVQVQVRVQAQVLQLVRVGRQVQVLASFQGLVPLDQAEPWPWVFQ